MQLRLQTTLFHLFMLLMLLSSTVMAQKIAFGNDSYLNYDTKTGLFDVFIRGRHRLKNGFSEVTTANRTISSKDFKDRRVSKTNFQDDRGRGQCYKFIARGDSGVTFVQTVYAYRNQDLFLIEVSVSGVALRSNQLFPLRGELVGDFDGYNSLFVPFDNDTFISYEVNPLSLKKENVSAEVTSIYNDISRNGFVVGTLDHQTWKTGVKTRLLNRAGVDLTVECGFTNPAITRDKIQHGYMSGSLISSSKIFFGYFNDWRMGMETYAKQVRTTEKPIVAYWKGPTPVGWNSWGAMQEKLSYEKAVLVVDFFAENLKTFRVGNNCFIDLDSYWDNMLRGNDYSLLKKFADYCKAKGLKPGIYWAPFTDWGYQGGPDRKAPGSDFTFGEMWTKVGAGYHDFDGARALDPTHPGTQKRMDFIVSNFKNCGFEMIKIDFLGHAAAESSRFYNPKITTGMQAYRVGMEHLLKCLDNKMLVYAAISPSLASCRYVQVRRIACDAFKSINDTQYTLNGLTNGWWQTYLYNYIDADHVVLANESTEANISRTLSAIVTGTLIVGDDFSLNGKWKQAAVKLFQNPDLLHIIADGKAFRPVNGGSGKGASSQFIKAKGKVRYVALFNYENKNAVVDIDFDRLGFAKSAVSSVEDLVSHQKLNLVTYQPALKPAEATMLKIVLK